VLVTAGLLARPLWDRQEPWTPPRLGEELDPFTGRILFTGFEGSRAAFDPATLEAEQCLIRHLTALPGVRLQDGREPTGPAPTPFMEVGGRVVGSEGEAKILLLVKRTSDRVVLYADDFALPLEDEIPCDRLAEWIRRRFGP